jgi:hypothetical protein
MYKYLLTFLVLLFLNSCTTTRLRMLENSGAIRTDFSTDPEYDYVVIMEGVTHMGWDGNNKEDRRNTLISMFGDRSKQLKIGDEVSVQAGSEQSGKKIPTWAMKVKCINQ